MKLTLEGTTYESPILALFKMSIGEARTIKRNTGLTILGWQEGLKAMDQIDPDICIGLIYLLRSRAGETVDWDALDELPVADVLGGFDFTLNEEDKSDMEKAVVAEAEQVIAKPKPKATKPKPDSTE